DFSADEPQYRIGAVLQPVVVIELVLAKTALDAGVEGIRSIGRDLVAEEIKRKREVQIELALHGRKIDHAELAHGPRIARVGDAGLLHLVASTLDDAADTGLAHEHMMRFLGEHETRGAGQGIETRLRQRL